MDQFLVPLYFNVYLRYNVRERTAGAGEVVVAVGNLFQRIGKVEGEVLFLGVKDNGQLVAFLHKLYHLLLLTLPGGSDHLARLGGALVGSAKFYLENPEGLGQIPFFKNCGNRFNDTEKQNQKQRYS